MFKKTRIAFPILLVLSLIALFVVSGSAMAHSSRPNGAKSAKAQDFLTGDVTAYVVHGIPGIPVDVYVNGQLALSNFQPGSTVGPVSLPNGLTTFQLYPVGAQPATTQPIAQSQIALGNVTVSIVAHLTADGHPTISAFFEEPGDLPGNGMLDIRHTAALGPVDVYLNTGINGALFKVYSGLTNGGNLQLLEPAGDYQVVITPAGASPDAAPLKGTFTVVSDKYLNVYAIGDPNAGTLGVVTQSFEIPALSF